MLKFFVLFSTSWVPPSVPGLNTSHSGAPPQVACVLVGEADMSQITGDDGVGTDNAMVVGTGHSGSPRKGPALSQLSLHWCRRQW